MNTHKQKRKVSVGKRKTQNTKDTEDTSGVKLESTAAGSSSIKEDVLPTVKLTKELLLAFEEQTK